MNAIPFRKFTAIEMDLFFSFCSQMRNKGTEKIRHSFEELKAISDYRATSIERFVNDLDRTYSKMLELSVRRGDSLNFERFVLFTGFKVNSDEQYVEIATNPDFKYIINEITENFTKFELQEFTSLRSSYAKTAFRLLKQFRQTGYWRTPVEEFRTLLDIPEGYKMDAIDRRVLKPIVEELSFFFIGLEVKKIKAKKGRKIEFFDFFFRAEDDFKPDGTKIFRNEQGEYYEQEFDRMTLEETKKVFPEPNIKDEKTAYGSKENIWLSLGEYLLLQQKGLTSKIEFMGDWKAKNGWKKNRQFAGGDYKKILEWDKAR